MTVTSVTAVAVSFRAIRFGTSAAAGAPVSGGGSAPAPADDSASSPAAVAMEPAASTSKVSSRAVALFQRLDSDQDGNISKDEFTSGAIDLLKRASVREHHRHVGRGEGIDKRDARWLARLERAFDRIDASGDGAVDQDELSAPMLRADRAPRGSRDSEPGGAAPQTTSVTSVTLVAVAIRRYTVDAAAAPAPAPAAPVAPAQADEPAAA